MKLSFTKLSGNFGLGGGPEADYPYINIFQCILKK